MFVGSESHFVVNTAKDQGQMAIVAVAIMQ